jgi:NADH-quinone oxidoreductase subunit F
MSTPPAQPLLLRDRDGADYTDLRVYQARGGYGALRKALTRKPEQIVDEVRKANLKGRGGAGFPAGMKWGFLPKDNPKPRYLVINADEGEPGTFKDRYFLLRDPHRLIEGCVIACYAIGAHTTYVYVRGEFAREIAVLERAIVDARQAGLLGPRVLGHPFACEIHVHRGAGAYICGEETALLESLEGRPGKPRLKPPFPAVVGAFGCPTIVNNVETIASVPLIVERGGEWWASLGVEGDGGVKLFGNSGHVKRPGLVELPMGTSLRDLIYVHGGGVLGDRELKAVIPGGSSTPVLLPHEIDVPLTFAAMQKAGSMLGTGCATVIAQGTCMVRIAARLARFYAHESCGQCTPCREGCPWLSRILRKFEEGTARLEDIDLILRVCDNIEGNTICPLGDACAMPVRALVVKFRGEFEEHVRQGGCPFNHNVE